MKERGVSFSPEAKPLHDDEALLLMSPYFIHLKSMVAGLEATFNEVIAPTVGLSPIMVEGLMKPDVAKIFTDVRLYLDLHLDREAQEIHDRAFSAVEQEYDSMLHGLGEIVDPKNIVLVTHETIAPPEIRFMEPTLREKEQGMNYPMFSFRFEQPELYILFPRDMAMQFGSTTYFNPESLSTLKTTDDYRRSLLAEGGGLLTANNSALLPEDYKNKPVAEKCREELRKSGYKVGWLPKCDPNSQRTGKRAFEPGHIDGHAALIEGPTGEVTLFVASSFMHQNRPTRDAILRAAEYISADPVEIDDTDLPHLSFNFIQLMDGSVVLPRSGKKVIDQYQPSGLEVALANFLGKDKVRLLPALNLLPRLNQGGLRCMTNILPLQFLRDARAATGQTLVK